MAKTLLGVLTILTWACQPTAAFFCDGPPSAGCTNGLWNDAECKCDCIPPYCPDVFGACASIGTCTPENPWAGCTPGDNCPWWKNPLKAEACTTKEEVPDGIWEIFSTRAACCTVNFPYSKVCLPDDWKPATASPTPYPTIGQVDTIDFRIIPVRFSSILLPVDADVDAFKEYVRDILKRILVDLAQKYESLKVIDVTLVEDRRLLRSRELLEVMEVDVARTDERTWGGEKHLMDIESRLIGGRALQRIPISVSFDVTVRLVEGIDFGPIIRNAVQLEEDDIIIEIRQWANRNGYGKNDPIEISLCVPDYTSEGFVECVPDTNPPTRRPTVKPTPEPTSIDEEVIPLRIKLLETPTEYERALLSDKLVEILWRIMSDLEKRYSSLTVLDIRYKNERRMRRILLASATTVGEDLGRMLQGDSDDLEFDIVIVREEGVDFRNVIHEAIENSSNEIADEVREWDSDLGEYFDVCILRPEDDASKCGVVVKDASKPTLRPTYPLTELDQIVDSRSSEETESGFPLWIIILIVVCAVLLLCCCCIVTWYMREQKKVVERSTINNNVTTIKSKSTPDDSDHSDSESDSDSDSDDSSDDDDGEESARRQVMMQRRTMMGPQYPPYMPVPGAYPPQQQDIMRQNGQSQFYVDDDVSTLPNQSLRDIAMEEEEETSSYGESTARTGAKPDPSMYSFTPYSSMGGHSAADASSAYTRETNDGRDPTLYLENGGQEPSIYSNPSYYGGVDPTMYSSSVRQHGREQDPSMFYGGGPAHDHSAYHSVGGVGDSYYNQSQYGEHSQYTNDMSMLSEEQSQGMHGSQYMQGQHPESVYGSQYSQEQSHSMYDIYSQGQQPQSMYGSQYTEEQPAASSNGKVKKKTKKSTGREKKASKKKKDKKKASKSSASQISSPSMATKENVGASWATIDS